MGTWGAGSFQNDTALGWAAGVVERNDAAAVRAALVRVMNERRSERGSFVGRLFGIRTDKSYLEARVAAEGLAAAEIVALWRGYPDPNLPEGLRRWAASHSDVLCSDLVRLAYQAVATIKTESELKELWEEGGPKSASEWHAIVDDLASRLGGRVEAH